MQVQLVTQTLLHRRQQNLRYKNSVLYGDTEIDNTKRQVIPNDRCADQRIADVKAH